MSKYDYVDSKANIIKILKSKTPVQETKSIPADGAFKYDNAVRCCVSAIFVDIKSSSELFKTKDEKLAPLLRAFTAEIIMIFQEFDKYNQIGIRGDCVYSIYSTPDQVDVLKVFRVAVKINTFMKMFNKLLENNHYPKIGVGIGAACGEELIIKAGRTGTGINDKIWIGDAVVDASNLSSLANRYGYSKIAINTCMWDNIKEHYNKEKTEHGFTFRQTNTIDFYDCNLVNVEFDNWIKRGMK